MIYDEHLEQSILGSIMHLNGFGEAVELAMDTLRPLDFFSVNHKQIFSAMKELYSKDINPDVMAVMGHRFMNDESHLLYGYAGELCKNTVSGLNLPHWIKSLKGLAELRRTQDVVNNINEIISSTGDIDEKLKDIEQIFCTDTGFTSSEAGAKHISDCMPNYLDQLEKRWTNPDEVVFTTGIPDLDDVLGGGFEVGLHAVAARPKMGKTELMGKMINHFAVDRGLPVYVGSLEMPDFQVIERLVSSYGRIDKTQIKSNFKDARDYDLESGAFSQACGQVGHSDIYIDDRHNNTVTKIRRECRKVVKKHGSIGGIFVDYLTLLDSDGKYDRHDLAIGAMTRALKGMSKEFMCPVVILLQLNRALESRSDKRPLPSDSRDSGAIEQDVDSWTAIYRDSVYNEDSHWKNITEIIVRLHRHGGTGTAYQKLSGSGFSNVDEQTVAELVHKEQTKDKSSSTGGF